MQTAKQEVQALLQELPDDATLEDIQYHIYVKQKIAQGLADVRAGRVISQEEVEKRFARWRSAASAACYHPATLPCNRCFLRTKELACWRQSR